MADFLSRKAAITPPFAFREFPAHSLANSQVVMLYSTLLDTILHGHCLPIHIYAEGQRRCGARRHPMPYAVIAHIHYYTNRNMTLIHPHKKKKKSQIFCARLQVRRLILPPKCPTLVAHPYCINPKKGSPAAYPAVFTHLRVTRSVTRGIFTSSHPCDALTKTMLGGMGSWLIMLQHHHLLSFHIIHI